ncbi:MAG: VanZ family protein [Clostridia bacterium]|nr:VanZ family protein [Clostridia bacterium]
MKRIFLIILGYLGVISIMVGIFCFSAQPAEESASVSGGIVKTIADRFFDSDTLTAENLEMLIDRLQFIVRKTAHYLVYAGLGFFAYMALKNTFEKRYTFVPAFAWGVLYSVSDEIHQLFVPGRSGEIRDVFLDSLGVATGVLTLMLIYNLLTMKNKRNIM